jgi:hypothetical protein
MHQRQIFYRPLLLCDFPLVIFLCSDAESGEEVLFGAQAKLSSNRLAPLSKDMYQVD